MGAMLIWTLVVNVLVFASGFVMWSRTGWKNRTISIALFVLACLNFAVLVRW